jgi:hypothetical protein
MPNKRYKAEQIVFPAALLRKTACSLLLKPPLLTPIRSRKE